MHDGAYFEGKGVPSVCCVSDAFKPQAQYQAASLGYGDAARVFVDHPISDQTTSQLHAKADKVYAATIRALTSNEVASVDESGDATTMALLRKAAAAAASDDDACPDGA